MKYRGLGLETTTQHENVDPELSEEVSSLRVAENGADALRLREEDRETEVADAYAMLRL